MRYVDGFLVPVPKRNVKAYVKLAKACSKIWEDHGALEYRECIGEDLGPHPGMIPFTKPLKTKRGETVVIAWIVYKSRKHRDQVNAKVMKDPRVQKMMGKKMPFDCKRMVYGGFDVAVEA